MHVAPESFSAFDAFAAFAAFPPSPAPEFLDVTNFVGSCASFLRVVLLQMRDAANAGAGGGRGGAGSGKRKRQQGATAGRKRADTGYGFRYSKYGALARTEKHASFLTVPPSSRELLPGKPTGGGSTALLEEEGGIRNRPSLCVVAGEVEKTRGAGSISRWGQFSGRLVGTRSGRVAA